VISLAWKIWKSKEERIREEFNNAINLRNQGNWPKAIEKLEAVYQMSQEVSDPGLKELGIKAAAMARIYKAKLNLTPENLEEAYKFLSSIDQELTLELPYKVRVGEVVQELKILAKDFSLSSGHASPNELENLAQEYLSLGKDKLTLSDILGINVDPIKRAFKLLGMSRTIIAQSKEKEDPEESVRIYSEALGYFNQAEDKESIDDLNEKIGKLSKVMKCYICGRSLQGEEIHFLYVKTDITPYMLKTLSSESPKPITDEGTIVLCRACYTAVNNLAEDIARKYYDMAMRAMRQMYEELSRRIDKLESDVQHVKYRLAAVS